MRTFIHGVFEMLFIVGTAGLLGIEIQGWRMWVWIILSMFLVGVSTRIEVSMSKGD